MVGRRLAVQAAKNAAKKAAAKVAARKPLAVRRAGKPKAPANAARVNATYEQVPYSKSDHLPGVGAGPDKMRREYSSEPALSWMDDAGNDIIYDAMGVPQTRTVPATGVYTPPGGELEINPAFVAGPQMGMSGNRLLPEGEEALNFGEMLRGYVGGQGASAWHYPNVEARSDAAGSLFLPAEGPVPLDILERMGAIGSDYGLPDFVDTGRGVTMSNFYPGPPTGGQTRENLASGMDDALRGLNLGEPQRAEVLSGYLPILEKGDDPRQGMPGSGWATDQLLSMADARPDLAARLDASPAIRQRAGAQADIDQMYSMAGAGPTREDLQAARRIFSEQGLEGLREARRRGVALPGIAAFMALYGLQDDDAAGY
jgi:hypothetical protein